MVSDAFTDRIRCHLKWSIFSTNAKWSEKVKSSNYKSPTIIPTRTGSLSVKLLFSERRMIIPAMYLVNYDILLFTLWHRLGDL